MEILKKIRKIGIGVVGLPGSGKSIVSEVARELNIPTIVMGDIIRQLCRDRGLEINSENVGSIMVGIRQEEGMNCVAKRTLPRIAKVKKNIVIIDGLRSFEEVEFFREHLNKFIIIAIHSSPRTRYGRIRKRNRFDDPQNLKLIQERDLREISVGIAKIIALTDIMFVNEGKIRPLKQRISKILQRIQDNRWK
ncbi:MAG: flagellar hook-basal body complex protein FliE [Candidatus Helarchaeota archaeon]|nr:flagellar hook-basal body complex protein FliE [Candidatus Helarchaeota archaeon]